MVFIHTCSYLEQVKVVKKDWTNNSTGTKNYNIRHMCTRYAEDRPGLSFTGYIFMLILNKVGFA